MRVAFLGNFRVPYTSESDYLWTMRERLGFEVVPLQETEVTAAAVLEAALDADAFFWVHTHGWETPGMDGVLAELRARGIPTIAYHLDLYMGLGRWRGYTDHAYMRVEHFFTVDKLMADWLNANTPTRGHFLRPGVVERDCRLESVALTRDVIFVGSYHYHPEWPYRPRLIDFLKATYGDRFEHWGPQGRGLVRGADLNALYASARVVVGDTLCLNYCYPYYTSDRAYEVIGRGGFLVHPRIFGMDSELSEDMLGYYDFGDFAGLKATIDRYLDDGSDREARRLRGHEHVKAHCTYTQRLTHIFEEVISG